MNKIINSRDLPILIKGMVFAIVLMFFSTSCCVTGYCQTSTTDMQQEQKETTKNSFETQ